MSSTLDHFFHGNPLLFGSNGFVIIGPGETATGPFYAIGPLDAAVTISAATSNWGGTLDGLEIKASVFGFFPSISVSSASTGSLIAYRTT
jgi:hypothetical protein